MLYKSNELNTFKIVTGSLLLAILILGINASAVATIEVFDGDWQTVSEEQFSGQQYPDYRYTTKTILLPSDTTKIRVTQSGTDTAHMDRALLDGNAPISIIDRSTDTELDSAKLAQSDYDVIDAAARTIEISWTNPGSVLILTAVEENLIGGPLMWSQEGYLEYTLGESKTYSQYLIPTSNHPASTYYATFSTSSEELIVDLDATGDNTLDPDGDWAELHIITPNGVKKFKVNGNMINWGTSAFEYTNMVTWQHKTYQFNIPLEEIGLSQGDELLFQISYYGTASVFFGGMVTDSNTENPLSGATVTLLDEAGNNMVEVAVNYGTGPNPQSTGNDGLFSFYPKGGIVGDYKIKAEKPGYAAKTLVFSLENPQQTISLTPEATCPSSEIPEFSTIALPVVSIIGMMFLFQRRKGK